MITSEKRLNESLGFSLLEMLLSRGGYWWAFMSRADNKSQEARSAAKFTIARAISSRQMPIKNFSNTIFSREMANNRAYYYAFTTKFTYSSIT